MPSSCTPDCIDTIELDFQPFPTEGSLALNTNLSLDELKSKIGLENSFVYCYVVATIKRNKGQFIQQGNGPNFQGDLITLCTCKHFMRTFLDLESWKGKWIAGFTGKNTGKGKNRLFYLMKVEHTFDSHYNLWHSKLISDQTKNAKVTSLNKFGDVYQPREDFGTDLYDYRNYYPPIENHGHYKNDEWYKDIKYSGMKGRKPILVASNIEYSFLWSKPLITLVDKLHRGQKKYPLRNLLESLR